MREALAHTQSRTNLYTTSNGVLRARLGRRLGLTMILAIGAALAMVACAPAGQSSGTSNSAPSATQAPSTGNPTAAATSAAPVAKPTASANFPTKDVELVVPFAPGGGIDLAGRTVARVLTEQKIVSKPIQIVNQPGAGGAISMAEMASKRKGDGHSLMVIAVHIHTTPLTQGTKETYKDLTPLARLYSEYSMLVVRAESPIKSLKDVAEAIKKDSGGIKFGGSAIGNAEHVTVAQFAKAAGADPTKLTYVSYSGGESTAAILGGHVDVGVGGPDLIDLVEAGKMRVLAISAEKRVGGKFKDIPTFKEQGYDVVNANWRGLFGPAQMPDYAVSYWKPALSSMAKTPAWKAELEKNQWDDVFDADGFTPFLAREYESYRSTLKDLGLLK